MPWFSIIVPALNEEKYLPLLIDSVFKQRYRPIELIVADEGSTDGTAQLTRNLAAQLNGKDFRIVRVTDESCSGKPRGPAYARNLGISKASGTYVLLLDADYILSDSNILSQLAAALEPEPAARFQAETVADNWLGRNLALDDRNPTFRWARRGLVSGRAFRMEVLKRFQFDSSLGAGEDKDFLTRVTAAGVPMTATIAARGVRRIPCTLTALWRQREWYGRTILLYLRKYHSLRDLTELLPPIPFLLFVGTAVLLLFSTQLAFVSASAFAAIVLLAIARSPHRSASRIAYIVLVRLLYCPLSFFVGLMLGLAQMAIRGSINRSRDSYVRP